MSDYHEPERELSSGTRNLHRALTSLKEEIEAVDWYNQRVAVCDDDALRAVLAHNRDEEIEHACMTLEWLRRNVPAWHEQLKTYLFTETDIVGHERAAEGESVPAAASSEASGLDIGSLKVAPRTAKDVVK